MREPARGNTGFWNSLRQGGVPSAIASIMGPYGATYGVYPFDDERTAQTRGAAHALE